MHFHQGSKEPTLSSGKEAPFNIALDDAKEGVKGSKKRLKQCPQGTTTMTDHNDREAGG
jgi:hypothetical protein